MMVIPIQPMHLLQSFHTHMKRLLFFFLLAAGALSSLQAQPGGGGGWNADPAQRAKQQTDLMTEKLALSDAQAAKVKEINLKYANKMKEAREKADGDWEAMRGTIGTIREEQDKELQTVMTEEQWQQWVKYREEERAKRGNMRREGPPPGDHPAPPPGEGPKKDKKKKGDSDSGQ